MINIIKKLLSRFNLQVVPKKENPVKEYSLVDEAVKFLDSYPKGHFGNNVDFSGYAGDINYHQDENGKTYYLDNRSEKYFCDYDLKNPSKDVLEQMIKETTFNKEDFEKLK